MEQEGYDGYDYYEGQPKRPLRKKIDILLGIISAVVYIIVMIRIFGACDNGFGQTILLDEAAGKRYENTGLIVVTRIYNETTEDDDGRIQLQYLTYLDDYDNFQLTLKFNSNHFPKSSTENYKYTLKKSGSEAEYTDVYFDTTRRIGYNYMRICFNGVEVDEDENLTLNIYDGDTVVFSADVFSPLFYKSCEIPDKIEYKK